MRLSIALAVTLATAAPALAQGYQGRDPGYQGGYPDDGYYGQPLPDDRDYSTQPPPAGAARPMPGYRDDERWSGGDSDASGDARSDDASAPPPPPPPPTARGNARAYRDAQADYRARLDAWNRQYGAAGGPDVRDRARIARWRARADACEQGDRAACDGPE